jgi:hypothetical protein
MELATAGAEVLEYTTGLVTQVILGKRINGYAI